MPQDMTVITTDGSRFTSTQSIELARLIYRRFGHDMEAATAAWARMLENDCKVDDFMYLVNYPEHTENCEGECQSMCPGCNSYPLCTCE